MTTLHAPMQSVSMLLQVKHLMRCVRHTALDRQDLSRTYLAHRELEREVIIIIAVVAVVVAVVIITTVLLLLLLLLLILLLLLLLLLIQYLMGVCKMVQGLHQGCQGAGRLRFCGSFSRSHCSLLAPA